jgi:hypothetical protein
LEPLGFKPTQGNRAPPISGWLNTPFELTHPLCSSPITGPSTLIRDDPPPCLASVLSRSWVFHLRFSLNIETTGSHVPSKSLNQGHAIFMPDAAQTVSRFPLDLSWRPWCTPSFDVISYVTTPHQWFACAHLLDSHLIPSSGTFSLTLTTLALYQSSLRWFETCSCKPVPRGLPSSFEQLHTPNI